MKIEPTLTHIKLVSKNIQYSSIPPSYTNRASGVYIIIYLYVYNKLQNGCKDPVENRQI